MVAPCVGRFLGVLSHGHDVVLGVFWAFWAARLVGRGGSGLASVWAAGGKDGHPGGLGGGAQQGVWRPVGRVLRWVQGLGQDLGWCMCVCTGHTLP
jgi:hypothetical protein